MTSVLLLGAGKIGQTIAQLLSESGDYKLTVADADADALALIERDSSVMTRKVDASDQGQLREAITGHDVVISALSFAFNPLVAEVALETGSSYFDLTEDVETTRRVRAVSERAKSGQIFMPQCGLAPGFISIVAYHLTKSFDRLDQVRMRVGALPRFPSNALKYNLTWSTDGLINEYCNPCEVIHESQRIDALPLEGLEWFTVDGIDYEAFNTSGGLGTLCETLDDRVRELNYKTIRHPGHRDAMALLTNDLRLAERRDLFKDILEFAIPVTYQDVVVTFATVSGWHEGRLSQVSDARKVHHREVNGRQRSAIQITTASAVCAVVDLHREKKLPESGFVKQEQVTLGDFLTNRFGKVYDSGIETSQGISGEVKRA